MKHVVLGTAGHVDHGKTALVKRLTGYDTDRLEEEKKRGLTIELGFAPLKLYDDDMISIVDVPGHEKFVKTMVSGASGIDIGLLVIAANEGIMPQTKEHINILLLLQVQTIIIVVTKIELVDNHRMDEVFHEIRQYFKGTVYANAPICPVSSFTGTGIEELKYLIKETIDSLNENQVTNFLKLPIDRVFSMKGSGTIVTGTLTGVTISKGDVIEILPKGLITKVKAIQVHGKSVESVVGGQRCAINLSNVNKSQLKRGDVLVLPNSVTKTTMMNTLIINLDKDKALKHNQKVHIYLGTNEVMGRLKIIGGDRINTGEMGYVQLKLDNHIVAVRGDRFIIRDYSPIRTIGGGKVINPYPVNCSRFKEKSIHQFEIEAFGSEKDNIMYRLANEQHIFSIEALSKLLFINKQVVSHTLEEGVKDKKVIILNNNRFIHHDTLSMYTSKLEIEFLTYYKKYPYDYQMNKGTLKSKVFNTLSRSDYDDIITILNSEGIISQEDDKITLIKHKQQNNIFLKKEVRQLEKIILNEGIQCYKLLCSNEKNSSRNINIIQFLLNTGRVVKLNETIYMHNKILIFVYSKIKKLLIEKEKVIIQDVKLELGIGRKLAIIILEYMDDKQITIREGNDRYKGKCFDK